VLLSYLEGNDIPSGKYVFSVRGQAVEEGVIDGELKEASDVSDILMERLEAIQEAHLVQFAGYQETVYLLTSCNAEACRAILASPRLVTLVMQMMRAQLQNGQPVKEIEQIAAQVLQNSPIDQPSEQNAGGSQESAPDNRDGDNIDYPSLVLHIGKLSGISESVLRDNLIGVQDAIFSELGVITPSIQLILDEMLPDNTFRLQINEDMQETVVGLEEGEYWVYMSMEIYREEITKALGSVQENLSARESVEPNTGDPAVIIKPSLMLEAVLTLQGIDIGSMMREAGLDVRDQKGYMIFCIAADVRRNVTELITPGITRFLLSKLEPKAPALISAVSQELGVQAITQELRRRVAARQPLHDLPAILEEMLVANFEASPA
jgi:type III secretory pathway component EscV